MWNIYFHSNCCNMSVHNNLTTTLVTLSKKILSLASVLSVLVWLPCPTQHRAFYYVHSNTFGSQTHVFIISTNNFTNLNCLFWNIQNNLVRWMQQSRICILTVFAGGAILCGNISYVFHCFRYLVSLFKIELLGLQTSTKSWNVCFYPYFQINRKTQFHPKCQLGPSYIHMTKYFLFITT